LISDLFRVQSEDFLGISGCLFDDQAVQWHRGAGELGDLLRPLWMLQESQHSGQRIQRPVIEKKTTKNIKRYRKKLLNKQKRVLGTQFH